VDFLTKKTKKNEGEVPQYYVENSHPAIVAQEVYDLAQVEIKKRKANGGKVSGLSPFSSRIICGNCGHYFGPKTWHSTSKYRRTVWRCNHKYNNGNCQTPHLYEAAIQKAFVEAFNQLYADRERLAEDYAAIIMVLTETVDLETERADLLNKCEITVELIRKAVEENARAPLNQADYKRRHDALVARYETAKARLGEVIAEKHDRAAKHQSIVRFIDELKQIGGALVEFDEGLWCEMVKIVTVYSEKDVAVTFRDGSVIRIDALSK
jgi:hypothetical protein